MIPRYHINVFWSDEDQLWIADIPDLRPCSAHGDSPEEALAEARVVIGMWIDHANERGLKIPDPRYRPAIYAAKFAA